MEKCETCRWYSKHFILGDAKVCFVPRGRFFGQPRTPEDTCERWMDTSDRYRCKTCSKHDDKDRCLQFNNVGGPSRREPTWIWSFQTDHICTFDDFGCVCWEAKADGERKQ